MITTNSSYNPEKEITRKEFLRTSAVSLSGLFFGLSVGCARQPKLTNEQISSTWTNRKIALDDVINLAQMDGPSMIKHLRDTCGMRVLILKDENLKTHHPLRICAI